MPLHEFEIEFTYDKVYYSGIVHPFLQDSETRYEVHIEDESQEIVVDVTLRPSISQLEDWEFYCHEGQRAEKYYDKNLLEEICKQVEACLGNKGKAAS